MSSRKMQRHSTPPCAAPQWRCAELRGALEASSPRDRASHVWSTYGLMIWFVLALVLTSAASSQASPWDSEDDPFVNERNTMVQRQILKRGIETPQVIDAMQRVPRHLFVPENDQPRAYQDIPVIIAPGKTLSQAYVSARMVSLLDLSGEEKVLEIGTGSGYDAALLSRMAAEVYTIEIDEALGQRAATTLRDLGYQNVHVRVGDGYHGWPEVAPFDAILLTAAPERIPQPLLDQLKVGGRMVLAVGGLIQNLQLVTKTEEGHEVRRIDLVNLSPMTGDVQQKN